VAPPCTTLDRGRRPGAGPARATRRADRASGSGPCRRQHAGASGGLDHLPSSTRVGDRQESYTPDFDPRRFAVTHQRFAARSDLNELRDVANDYLLLSSAAYSRFADSEALVKPHQREFAARYQQIFATFPLLQEWDPDEMQLGPVLRLYRLEPLAAECRDHANLAASDAFVSDPAMHRVAERPVRWTAPGQWALFKTCLLPGRYRIAVEGDVATPGLLVVADRDGKTWARLGLAPGSAAADFEAPSAGKWLLYAWLAPGDRVGELTVRPLHSSPGG